MARTGRFGSLPARATDLSATIAALQAQFEQQQDTNMLSAWTNGGMYNGKKVTDEMLLSHLKERMSEVDKSDPMYTHWRDLYWQYNYSINEQKATLKYTQDSGKHPAAAATQLASFYHEWAHKVPKNSAIWRTMMTNAARFENAARAANAASSAGSKTAAYQATVDHIQKTLIDPANRLTQVLQGAAIAQGMDLLSNTGIKLNATDSAHFDQLINSIRGTPEWDSVRAAMRSVPGWDGHTISMDMAMRVLRNGAKGADQAAGVATRYGYQSYAATYKGEAQGFRHTHSDLVATNGKNSLFDKYLSATQTFNDAMTAAGADSTARLDARRAYADALSPLRQQALRLGQLDLGGSILDKMTAVTGGKVDQGGNVGELQLEQKGDQAGDPNATGTSLITRGGSDHDLSDAYNKDIKDATDLYSGKGQLALLDASGKPTTNPQIGHIGVVAATPGAPASYVPLPGKTIIDGKGNVTHLPPSVARVELTITHVWAYDPVSGAMVDTGVKRAVTATGHVTWGATDSSGQMGWSTTPPFDNPRFQTPSPYAADGTITKTAIQNQYQGKGGDGDAAWIVEYDPAWNVQNMNNGGQPVIRTVPDPNFPDDRSKDQLQFDMSLIGTGSPLTPPPVVPLTPPGGTTGGAPTGGGPTGGGSTGVAADPNAFLANKGGTTGGDTTPPAGGGPTPPAATGPMTNEQGRAMAQGMYGAGGPTVEGMRTDTLTSDQYAVPPALASRGIDQTRWGMASDQEKKQWIADLQTQSGQTPTIPPPRSWTGTPGEWIALSGEDKRNFMEKGTPPPVSRQPTVPGQYPDEVGGLRRPPGVSDAEWHQQLINAHANQKFDPAHAGESFSDWVKRTAGQQPEQPGKSTDDIIHGALGDPTSADRLRAEMSSARADRAVAENQARIASEQSQQDAIDAHKAAITTYVPPSTATSLTPALSYYAESTITRGELASLNGGQRLAVYNNMLRDDPALAADPYAQQRVQQQMDQLAGAGEAGLSESDYWRQKVGTSSTLSSLFSNLQQQSAANARGGLSQLTMAQLLGNAPLAPVTGMRPEPLTPPPVAAAGASLTNALTGHIQNAFNWMDGRERFGGFGTSATAAAAGAPYMPVGAGTTSHPPISIPPVTVPGAPGVPGSGIGAPPPSGVKPPTPPQVKVPPPPPPPKPPAPPPPPPPPPSPRAPTPDPTESGHESIPKPRGNTPIPF